MIPSNSNKPTTRQIIDALTNPHDRDSERDWSNQIITSATRSDLEQARKILDEEEITRESYYGI